MVEIFRLPTGKRFGKRCPRCFEEYTKLIKLKDDEYVCDQCLTEIESHDIQLLIIKKEITNE